MESESPFFALFSSCKAAAGTVKLGDQRPDLNRWLVRKVLSDVYFLHFAGNQQDMLLLDNEDSVLNSGRGDLNDRKPIHG